MKHQMKTLALLAAAAITLLLPACNTTKGVGKDIEKAGEGLKNSADKHGAD
jgi:predicted small secreted protein